jgi:hypothetical protein
MDHISIPACSLGTPIWGCRLVCVWTGELVKIVVWAGLRAAWVTFLFQHVISGTPIFRLVCVWTGELAEIQ